MNDNLEDLIARLVYKNTDSNGWAPQNKLGQYLARLGRSVRELGYEKMSNFFQDRPERYLVEKDEHGLPVVKLLGEPPVTDDSNDEFVMGYQTQNVRPRNNMPQYRQNRMHDYPYNEPNQGGYQRYGGYNNYNRRQPPMYYNDWNNRGPQHRMPDQMSLFRWAFFPDREEWLQMLADLAKENVWHYENNDPEHPNTALFDYLRDTFRQLKMEGRVLESRAEGIALFNTGLLDREEGRPIYAVFGPNPNRNRQPWLFQEFFLSSGPALNHSHGSQTPNSQEAEEMTVEPAADVDDGYTDDDDDENYNVPPLPPGEEPHYYN